VYLTCLHESGHAFGLAHTRNFADIMYSFQYGGDIAAYFGRYRVRLKTRADIAGLSGISDADRVAMRLALRETAWGPISSRPVLRSVPSGRVAGTDRPT